MQTKDTLRFDCGCAINRILQRRCALHSYAVQILELLKTAAVTGTMSEEDRLRARALITLIEAK